MANNILQVRIDSATKTKAAAVFSALGMDLSTGVKVYLYQVLKSGGIPFSLLTDNGFTKEQESKLLKISKSTERIYKDGKRKPAHSIKAFKKEVLS